MIRTIFVYLVLFLSLIQCRHYFVRDAAKYNLTQEEENILKSKKIGVIGFHPFYIHGMQYCCDTSNPQSLSKNLLRVLQFVSEKKEDEEISIDPNYFVTVQERYRIELRLSEQDTASEYLKFTNRLESKNILKPDKTISENNLRIFLKTYLDRVQHLGYKEVMDIIDFSDKNKIYLKKNDFDFWFIGFHSPTTSDSPIKPLLSIVPFIFTLGIFPLLGTEEIRSDIWIFDKKLNLIKKMEFKNSYDYFAAIWAFWQDESNSGIIRNGNNPTYIYEPDLKEFSKELAKIVRGKN